MPNGKTGLWYIPYDTAFLTEIRRAFIDTAWVLGLVPTKNFLMLVKTHVRLGTPVVKFMNN